MVISSKQNNKTIVYFFCFCIHRYSKRSNSCRCQRKARPNYYKDTTEYNWWNENVWLCHELLSSKFLCVLEVRRSSQPLRCHLCVVEIYFKQFKVAFQFLKVMHKNCNPKLTIVNCTLLNSLIAFNILRLLCFLC